MRDRKLGKQFLRWRDRGDVDALTRVFDATAPGLFALANHLVHEPNAAEDLVQSTFLAAIERARSYDPSRPLYPWLAGILFRRARKFQRENARQVEPDRLDEQHVPDPAQLASSEELERCVGTALDRLPPRYAEVLRPYLVDGHAPREIAAEQGLAPGTVRVQLHRGLDLLRRSLPPGLSLGAAALLRPSRGLGAVRAEVARAAASIAISPAGAVALAPPTLFGVTALSTKTLAASVLTLGAIGWWLLPDASEPGPSHAAADPIRVELAGNESAALAPPVISDTARESSAARPIAIPEPRPGPTDPEPEVAVTRGTGAGVFLVGEMSGVALENDETIELEVEDFEQGLGKFYVRLDRSGRFEIDLAPHAELGQNLPRLLWVRSRHAGTFDLVTDAWIRDPPAPEGDPQQPLLTSPGQRVEYECKLEFVRQQVVIRGRVRLPSERDATEAKVAFGYHEPVPHVETSIEIDENGEEMEVTEEWISSDQLNCFVRVEHCAADGNFELHVEHARPGRFVVYSPWHRPLTFDIDFADGPVVDLGEVLLEDGARVEGRALFAGEPLEEGWISLRLAAEPSGQNYDSLFLVGEEFVHGQKFHGTGPDGHFEFEGLERAAYVAKVIPHRIGGRDYHYADVVGSGQIVQAPATGLRIECPFDAVEVRLRADGEAVGGAVLRRFRVDGGRLDGRDNDAFNSMQWMGQSASENGSAGLLVHPRDPFTLAIEAPGFEPWREVVSRTDFGAEGVLEIELTPSRQLARTVVFELVGSGANALEGLFVQLALRGSGFSHTEFGEARVTGGRLTFLEVPAGRYWADLVPGIDPDRAPGEQPYLLRSTTIIEEGAEHVSVNARTGGRLLVELGGVDAAHAPELFLAHDDGRAVSISALGLSGDGKTEAGGAWHEGENWIGESLEPGTWSVVQSGDAYPKSSTEVEIQAGETTRVRITFGR